MIAAGLTRLSADGAERAVVSVRKATFSPMPAAYFNSSLDYCCIPSLRGYCCIPHTKSFRKTARGTLVTDVSLIGCYTQKITRWDSNTVDSTILNGVSVISQIPH
jgi:hypothetical protein